MPDLLSDLVSSKEFEKHVEGMIIERMAEKNQARKEVIQDLHREYFEGYRWRAKAVEAAMAQHGGQPAHDLAERDRNAVNKINAGIYHSVMTRLREIAAADAQQETGGEIA